MRCLLALLGFLVLPAATAPATQLSAQDLTHRTPNLEDGWVGSSGTLHFHFLHRFWIVRTPGEDKLVNSPTLFLGAPLPGRVLVGGRYGSNSLVANSTFNEWELLARWAPINREGQGLRVALTGAWNASAGSADGEVAASLPLSRLRLLGTLRGFSDALGEGEAGWAASGGLVIPLRDHLSLAGDLGALSVDGSRRRAAWGAGLHLRIPTTPHTLSLQASNTRTGTLQGSSVGGRTVWGFEFTIPMTPSRYFGGGAGGAAGALEPERAVDPDDGVGVEELEVTMTQALAYAPATLRISAGQTVVWRNTTPLIHTVTADPERVPTPGEVSLPSGASPFDSGEMRPGEEFRHTFTQPGEYRYVCLPHLGAGMVGRILVEP